MVRLEIDFGRRNIGVEVYVWDKCENRFAQIDALFDTGAHNCSIDTDLFLDLGYSLDDATRSFITTATKINEEVRRVRIDKILLDDTKIESVLFNTYEFPVTSYPVIIGMNVIRNFKVEMDFRERLITMHENYLDENDKYYDTDIFGDWRADSDTIGYDNVNE